MRCIHIGLLCVQTRLNARPTMSSVFRLWRRDVESHGRGLWSLLGTPEGTLLGILKDKAVHTNTMEGTP
ncbi:hypothetical protein F8388_023544 [Cannabis sativa]|uniref:Uncharacterized protein n=1 Tax=Cannabis sativa TaxID=3483 RepID=A0A7J6EFX9_CANSA|nr:hypothetical protein F8388_023544 [Cannabis sativa]